MQEPTQFLSPPSTDPYGNPILLPPPILSPDGYWQWSGSSWVPRTQTPLPRPASIGLGSWIIATVLIFSIVIGAGYFALIYHQQHSSFIASAPKAVAPSQIKIEGPLQLGSSSVGVLTPQEIAAKVNPAIVDINVTTILGQAAGTGMVLTSQGEILTNNHVVNTSTAISVVFPDQSVHSAFVIGTSPSADVALIQVSGVSNLPTITLSSSSTLAVGDSVNAIGNALGLGGTPSQSSGQIVALEQSISASVDSGPSEHLSGLIEANTPISPGDSGGALVNSSGEVVGMVTAGQVGGYNSSTSTTNYAIPSDTLLGVINLIRAGTIDPSIVRAPISYIGVQVRNLTPSAANRLGLNVTQGILVVGVEKGGPADTVGISVPSVITKVGGTPLTDSSSLAAALKALSPGSKVNITWVDQFGSHTSAIVLGGMNA